jgi:hypothetical protein
LVRWQARCCSIACSRTKSLTTNWWPTWSIRSSPHTRRTERRPGHRGRHQQCCNGPTAGLIAAELTGDDLIDIVQLQRDASGPDQLFVGIEAPREFRRTSLGGAGRWFGAEYGTDLAIDRAAQERSG